MVREAPTRCAIYARVSLDRQGQSRTVNRQITECQERAEQLGWPLAADPYKDNDISAKSGRPRPGFEALLEDISAGVVDGLLAVHLDRVLRRVMDLERVLDAIEAAPGRVHVSFVNAGDLDLNTSGGRLLARILASVAANESEQKSERVASARRQEAMSGRAHTVLGYGYNADRSINAEEAVVIKRVVSAFLDGKTLYELANDLNDDGVPTPGANTWTYRHVANEYGADERPGLVAFVDGCRQDTAVTARRAASLLQRIGATQADGSDWTPGACRNDPEIARCLLTADTVVPDGDIGVLLTNLGVPPPRMFWRVPNLRSMIRRGTLCGWRDYGPGGRGGRGEMVAQGDWSPILTKETVEAVRLKTDKADPVKGGRKAKYLLSTIATCGGDVDGDPCGAPLGGSFDKRSEKVRYACSQQPGLARCGRLTVVAEHVDEFVTAALLARISQTPTTVRRRRHPSGQGVTADDIAKAEQTLEQVRRNRTVYALQAGSLKIGPEEYATLREGLDQTQKEAERVIGAYGPETIAVLRDVPRRAQPLQAYWNAASLERQREIVKLFIEKVVIRPSTRGGNAFDFSRIEPPVWRL